MQPRESGREGDIFVNQDDRNENRVPQQPGGQPHQDPAQHDGQQPYMNPAQPYGEPQYRDPGEPYGQPPFQNSAQIYTQPLYREESSAAQPPSPEMQRKLALSRLRHAGNNASMIPIIMTLAQIVAVIVAIIVWAVFNLNTLRPFYRHGNSSRMVKYMMSQMGTFIILTIVSVFAAMIITALIGRCTLRQKIFGAWKRPKWTAPGFAKCLVLLFGIVGVGVLLATGLENLSKAIGLKTNTPNVNLTGNRMADAALLAYVCVLGPIMEETLFRGMILQSLRPWGDRLAIIVSAVLFGLAHLNLYQGLPAVLLGLLFGFATVKTGSIVPSALMHILCNSFSMTMMANGIETNETLQECYVIFLAAAVLGSILLFAFRKIDFSGIGTQPAPGVQAVEHPYRTVFVQSAAFWVLVACFLLFTFLLTGASTLSHM